MTMHLSPQELVTALDKALTPARREHLEACASCQQHVAELRGVVDEAALDSDVPEPSPLFWDHFHARVLAAAQSEQRAPAVWWQRWLEARTLVAVVAVVIAVAASAAVYVSRSVIPVTETVADSGSEAGVVADAATSLDTDEWEFVTSVMGTLEEDDMHEVLATSPAAVDAVMESLTSDERDRLAQLLKARMAEGLE